MSLSRCSGFTIIEILFTLLIAGASFSVILALQNSVVSSVLRSNEQLEASLITRDFFAALEIDQQREDSELVSDFESLTPLEAMEYVLETPSQGMVESLRQKDSYLLSLITEPIDLPELGSEVAHKLELTVSWGSGSREFLTTTFILANQNALPIRQGS